jgi:hypothetical protein
MNYNCQDSEKELFATSGWQIWQIGEVFHMTTSSSQLGQVCLGGRKTLSPWAIAQLAIQKPACGRETTRNAILKL